MLTTVGEGHKVRLGAWRVGLVALAWCAAWSCSSDDTTSSDDSPMAGAPASSGGESAETAGGGPAGVSNGGAGGHAGTAGPANDAGQGGNPQMGGAGGNTVTLPQPGWPSLGSCGDADIETLSPSGGQGGQPSLTGAGGDEGCQRPLEDLCPDGICPAIASEQYGGLCIDENYGEQTCEGTFPSSCGGYSVRASSYDATSVWHFDATQKLVGAVVAKRNQTDSRVPVGCRVVSYGETCTATPGSTATNLCDLHAGSCQRPLSEWSYNPPSGGGLYVSNWTDDCGGTTVSYSGERVDATWDFSYDARGALIGVVYRYGLEVCSDGSIRAGSIYGRYCAKIAPILPPSRGGAGGAP